MPGRNRPPEEQVTALEERARALAETHLPVCGGCAPVHLARLDKLHALFERAYGWFSAQAEQKNELPSAAEWLLDNYYVVQQALAEVRQDLPPSFFGQLPMLAGSPAPGGIRVHALSQELTAGCTLHQDPERVQKFIAAYQQIAPLTIGELWALPAILRLATLERLGSAAEALLDSARDTPASGDDGAGCAVSDAILDLRAIDVEDWAVVFESLSLVEKTLRLDPARLYARMEFKTRDRYRKAVEEIAIATGRPEIEVAQAAVALAEEESRLRETGFTSPTRRRPRSHLLAVGRFDTEPDVYNPPAEAESDGDPDENLFTGRAAHVGFFLLDQGRETLERRMGYKPKALRRLRRWLAARAMRVYLGCVFLATGLILAGLGVLVLALGGGLLQAGLALLAGLIPALTAAIGLVHTWIPRLIHPKILPKMDFQDGIPDVCRTLVVIPALISSAEEVKTLLRQLEQHYLYTLDKNLSFALLTDYVDAPEEHMPGDKELLDQAQEGIRTLNRRYERAGASPFHLLHRSREWNPREGVWMGWERKRGKLVDLVRLLSGDEAANRRFTLVGDPIPQIRFVITLDADSVLTRGGARRLIATFAHPLNRAEFDPQTGDLTAGYTVLQPRVRVRPESVNRTYFTRLFAGDPGLDLYTQAVSDVYQDLFQEGIYVGKGIFDVEAFRHCMEGRVPENALLSHDLFEGILGRAGLVTDVVLLENFPTHYLAFAERMHRWIRGDWQLLPWLFPRVPAGEGRRVPNYLSALDRWKIFDNLRRSLLAPAMLFFLIAGWFGLPSPAILWMGLAVLAPAISILAGAALKTRLRWPFFPVRDNLRPLGMDAARWAIAIILLPFEALLILDAIGITLIRLAITRRRMLEWVSAASIARAFRRPMMWAATWRRMVTAPASAVVGVALILLFRPESLPAAAPLLAAWFASPLLVIWLSRPLASRQPPLLPAEKRKLRTLARRTWMYYETFVGPEDNWLPPDHFQEFPRGLAAHRTSPTNIGFLLLACLAAGDLGYVGLLGLALRINSTLDTLEKMERYRGHLLNWYDTRSLAPLTPGYVSTVDSGNLAASLIALSQACQTLPGESILRWARWRGLQDTLAMLAEGTVRLTETPVVTSLRAELADCARRIDSMEHHPDRWVDFQEEFFLRIMPRLDSLLLGLMEHRPADLTAEILDGLRIASDRVRHHLMSMRRETTMLLPWLMILREAPASFSGPPSAPAVEQGLRRLAEALPATLTLADIPDACRTGAERLAELRRSLADGTGGDEEALAWCTNLESALESSRLAVESLLIGLSSDGDRADAMVREMDFSFLFDTRRQVFFIGYNLEAGKLDDNHYDLLASEARLASLVAIAKRDVPLAHWLHLGRSLTRVGDSLALLSWSGTMFEYLMPTLLTRSYPDTLLDQSCQAAVRRQIQYARRRGVPWGISESGFYAFDAAQSYQYRAFGVPGLGIKRGLESDLVITPHASLMALPFAAREVMANLAALADRGMVGRYGLYESLDFTPARLPIGAASARVQSYMSHHHGMILTALANALCDEVMVRRFHADPRIQTVDLLLQEQLPTGAAFTLAVPPVVTPARAQRGLVSLTPWREPVRSPAPRAHLLSNGRYSVVITSTGTGFSRWQGKALTRWRADPTLENSGMWIYIKDFDTGRILSPTVQPLGGDTGNVQILFYPYKAEFHRRDKRLALKMEVFVAPADDAELRILTITNQSERTCRLMISSYGEPVLAPPDEDRRHPAFQKLFLESEFLPEQNALLLRRRPRSPEETPAFLLHMLVTRSGARFGIAHESDRARFLGRGRDARKPAFLDGSELPPSGETGATLDPVFALARDMRLGPHAARRLAFVTIAAGTRAKALAVGRRYATLSAVDRAAGEARLEAENELRRESLDTPDLAAFDRMLSALLYPGNLLRADAQTLAANRRSQPGLWGFGISGDLPILLVRLRKEDETAIVRDALRAHSFWRKRGIMVDLVLLIEKESGYAQELQGELYRLIVRMDGGSQINSRGGIFILSADQMAAEDRVLLATAARIILDGSRGTLAAQIGRTPGGYQRLPVFNPARTDRMEPEPTPPLLKPADLHGENGFGGFRADGGEYCIFLPEGKSTPKPWINVIANSCFGFTVSESGGGYTWADNSSENRLTPWTNDPVTDEPGEALYLRDEETAAVWSPTPRPAPGPGAHLIRHGAGYSIFEHHSHGLRQVVRMFVVPDAPVKVIALRVKNLWSRQRRLTATYYLQWVLGNHPEITAPYIVSEYEPGANAILARNPYHPEFAGRVAFLASSHNPHGLTADRTEFIGRLGDLRQPRGLTRIGLAGSVRAGLDPCAAIMMHVELKPGEEREVFFVLGEGADRARALRLARKYSDPGRMDSVWDRSRASWEELLGAVRVETPDPEMDWMLNRWLLYQTMSSRMWGRTGLYQSGGAFGFRDQLQDSMALLHAAPAVAREHILESARHQFAQGDVLHWWHPPGGRGVRTRFSDDLLWLPYAVARYVEVTGDATLPAENVPFLEGDPLRPEEAERYASFERSPDGHPLWEHCRRAIERGATAGAHGLPLIGGGDWNDGFNRVGAGGRGESVWLGWFLRAVCERYAGMCESAGRTAEGTGYRLQADALRRAVDGAAWDGAWYRRAFFDDGASIGSVENPEWKIDSIAQSWAVLSGAADPERAAAAMNAVLERLVRPADALILLADPPFDSTDRDPGYIKAYPPGVRENGGMYVHAAIWTAWAFLRLGRADEAYRLWRMINPAVRAGTPEGALRYQVEPYAVAADISNQPGRAGRGGWTWYTGSAGWMYRLGLEGFLGLRRTGSTLRIDPAIPKDWPEYRITYRFGQSTYRIRVSNPAGVSRGVRQILLDGQILMLGEIQLKDDGALHEVEVELGEAG
jgi:cyclic beta-1,2-glucan synthetase